MRKNLAIILGKTVRLASKAIGGGSAMPGLVVEKIYPESLEKSLKNLPYGVVVISGTNGKTTTTKIVSEILQSHGLKVFTNSSGSNFVRGVISSIIAKSDLLGNLNCDIAVLELDEAHARHFIKHVKPTHSLLLNVLRDQLDRFGEIDQTAKFLKNIAKATTDNVVINSDDENLNNTLFTKDLTAKVSGFNVSENIKKQFTYERTSAKKTGNIKSTSLVEISDNGGKIKLDSNTTFNFTTSLIGKHNFLNCTAGVALCNKILDKKFNQEKTISALKNTQAVFGRGEKINYKNQEITLILVKNPSGFNLSLKDAEKYKSKMIAINDNYADGRDMSWLWDVDFSELHEVELVSGARSYDMELRLMHDNVNVKNNTENIGTAIKEFLSKEEKTKVIFCTYTSMLKIREELKKYTKLKKGL